MKNKQEAGVSNEVVGAPAQEFHVPEVQGLFDALREKNPALAEIQGPLALEYTQPVNYTGELTPQLAEAVCSTAEVEKITIMEGGLIQRQTTADSLIPINFDWVNLHLTRGAYLWSTAKYPEYFAKACSWGLEFPTEGQGQEAEVLEQVFRDSLGDQRFSFSGEVPVFEKKAACSMVVSRDYRVSFWFHLLGERLPEIGDEDYHLSLFAQKTAVDPLLDFKNPDLARLEYWVSSYWTQFMPFGKADVQAMMDECLKRAARRRLVVEFTKKISDEVVAAAEMVLVPRLGCPGFTDPTKDPINAIGFPQVSVHPVYTRDTKYLKDFVKRHQPVQFKNHVKPLFSFQKPLDFGS